MRKFILFIFFVNFYVFADYCDERAFGEYFKNKSANTNCIYTAFSKKETILENNDTELFRINYVDNYKIGSTILSNISYLYFLTKNNSCTIKPYPLHKNIEKILNNNTDPYNCHETPSSIDEDEFYGFVKKCVIKGSLKNYDDYSYFIYTYVTMDKPNRIQRNYLLCDGTCKWNMTFNTNCSYQPSIFNKNTTEKSKYSIKIKELILIGIGVLAFIGAIILLLMLKCMKRPNAIYKSIDFFEIKKFNES